jgi:hypothetical protein
MIQNVVYNQRNTLDLLRGTLLLAFAGFRRKKLWVNKRYNTTLTNNNVAQEFVQPDENT